MNELLIEKEAVAKTLTKKKLNKSNLIYKQSSFHSDRVENKLDSFSFESKFSYLLKFYDNLKKRSKIRPTKLSKHMIEPLSYTVNNLKNIMMNMRNEYGMLKRISSITNSSL